MTTHLTRPVDRVAVPAGRPAATPADPPPAVRAGGHTASGRSWPAIDGLGFGGDYNPEQWDESVWPADIALMRTAGVNLVSVGIFAWANLETSAGTFDFGWLDRILALLQEAGIAVDLGTPTAAPPAWFYRDHPDAWVVDADGRRLGPGSRGMCCPSSPAYRAAITGIAGALARRYADHPAVVMWHVHNEYGAPVSQCHCEHSQIAFRDWLLDRYGSLAAINAAWGTRFWGQTYHRMDEIRTPAAAASVLNPAQRLDFLRFSDDELRACFVLERDTIRAHSGLPVTTNFMATSCPSTDLWKWAPEMDVVSNDHYLTAERGDRHVLLAMDADLTRSLAAGRPWMLMEHSTSAVNWQPRNLAKEPGEMLRNSLTHVARGADAALFFQWRASRSGAEKFHSAMLPHAGTGSDQWRELVELGRAVQALAPVRGSAVRAEVAVLWDWESFWAQDLDWRPTVDLGHRERTVAFYTRLWEDRLTVDFAYPTADLSRYRLVVVPQMYLLDAAAAAHLERYVAGGGHLVVSYFSGVVDGCDAVQPEGLSGPLGRVLGVDVHEFAPLESGASVQVRLADRAVTGHVWTDRLLVPDPAVEVVGVFDDGPAAGRPALTRRTVGAGSAWYLATRLDGGDLRAVMDLVYADAGLRPAPGLPAGLEQVFRERPDETFRFLVNHTDTAITVEGIGVDLISGHHHDGHVTVPAGDVVVLRLGGRST